MELFDICDETGNPTGKTAERDEAHRLGILHRTAHIWITRKNEGKTQILLQKRSGNKDSFPGMYDTSSAGHIPSGSGPEESACRELKEELGLTAVPSDLIFIGRIRNQYEKEFHGRIFRDNEVMFAYVLAKEVKDDEISVQKEEVERTDWFDFSEVYRECQKGSEIFCVPAAALELLKKYLEEKC